MDYLNDDIKTIIDKLREHYPNDNTFKSYTNVLSVISSHFKELHHIYQPLTKVGLFMVINMLKKEAKIQFIKQINEYIMKNIMKNTKKQSALYVKIIGFIQHKMIIF
jgi:hypothetical protein